MQFHELGIPTMQYFDLALRTAVALIHVGVLFYGFKLAFRNFCVDRSAKLMERFSGAHFLEIREAVDRTIDQLVGKSEEEKIIYYRAICSRNDGRTDDNRGLFNQLHALGMFFGEIGVLFEQKVIDQKGFEIFDRLLPYYWVNLKPFIIACHDEFGFPINRQGDLARQKLYLFQKFATAYVEMHELGIAKEPNT